MKMDLRLVAVCSNKQLSDNGYDEFAKLVSEPKLYKGRLLLPQGLCSIQ